MFQSPPSVELRPEDIPWEEFSASERKILREQAEEQLPPGGESAVFKIWRCAHCREIRPFSDGGTSWTGPSVGSGVLCEEERSFLGQCCDKCWCAIMKVLAEVYRRHIDEL